MTIMNVNRGKFFTSSSHEQRPLVLRDGQILQGEIVRIYPNNKAEIQIGNHRLVAEINTSLVAGQKYFFQVHGTENQLVHLKVLGDSFKQNIEENVMQLLDKLGLKSNRPIVQFVQSLLTDKIPFNRHQLIQAISFIETSQIRNSVPILKEMFVHRLPITENVFQALYILKNNELSSSMNQLFKDVAKMPQGNQTQNQLLLLLEQLLAREGKSDMLFQGRIGREIHQQVFSAMLHQKGNESLKQTFSLTKEQVITQLNRLFFAQTENNRVLTEQLIYMTKQLSKHKTTFIENANDLINRFQGLSTSNLSNQLFTVLSQMIQKHIIPYLPNESKQVFTQVIQQNNSTNQANLYQLLQLLANESTYTLLEQATSALKQESTHFHIAAKTTFLSFVQQFIQSSGMLDEHELRQNIEMIANRTDQSLQPPQTIKSLLLQMIQEGSQLSNDKVLPMIHFINGLQIQSMNESQNMIQATLQLPGEKFALPKDLYFQFEGKKTTDGKLDPNYCRILFFLHLQHIEETVVDMFIQKRIVSLTIYNDHKTAVEKNGEKLVTMLTDQLQSLNFQLSAISYKPLSERENKQTNKNNHAANIYYAKARYDFKI